MIKSNNNSNNNNISRITESEIASNYSGHVTIRSEKFATKSQDGTEITKYENELLSETVASAEVSDSEHTLGSSSPYMQRVSFEEDCNVQFNDENFKYEDVLTLQVPSKEKVWLSCNSAKRRFPWFRLKRKQSKNKEACYEETESGRNRLSFNGNRMSSIYENEPTDSLNEPNNKMNGNSNNNGNPCYDNNANIPHEEPEEEKNTMVWTTNILAAFSILLIVLTFPFSLIYCVRIVAEYERAVVLRMGNLIPKGKGTKGPGLFFILPCIDSVRKVDLRTITFAIPPQELLTRDSVTVSVDAVVYYRVLNPVASVLNIEDAARSTRLLAQTTIRNVLGTKDLAQILMERDEISSIMQTSLDSTTDAWGVKVERVEIKDVRLPVQLQRAMAAEAEAAREARAKVIAANGEHQAAYCLKKAARVIATSPMAFQLRYLQTLSAISTEKNSTIFFPVPIDIMQNLNDLKTSNLGNWPFGPSLKKPDVPLQGSPQPQQADLPSETTIEQDRSIWTAEDGDTESDTV